MTDPRLLLNTYSVIVDPTATDEERSHFLLMTLDANQAVSDFVMGRIDLDTFLDKMEASGVNIDSYFDIVEDNFNYVGIG